TLTNNSTGATVAGTFSGSTPVGTATITVGSNTLTLTAVGSGSDTCSSSTAGTFLNTGAGGTAIAKDFTDAINACVGLYPAVGVTAARGGAVVTLTTTTVGSAASLAVGLGSPALTNFSCGSVTPGSDGSPGCATSTTGTFALGTDATTQATNFAAAINICPTAAGVTASSSSGTVTITARTGGTGGNSIALAKTLTNFSWTRANLTGGTNGDNPPPNCTSCSGSTCLSTTP